MKDLSNEEIIYIKSFIQEVSNIPMIECIYLTPYKDINNNEHIHIVAIRNISLYYNSKLTGKESMSYISCEYESIDSIIQRYSKKFENCRLSFIVDNDWNYSLSLMHKREIYAEMALATGTILFDRFGDKEKNKQYASRMFYINPDALKIKNIDELFKEDTINEYKKELANNLVNTLQLVKNKRQL